MFIAASCSLIPHVSDAHTAETLALKHGLMLANDLGFHSIQIESDSIEVINACSGQERIWSGASAVYAECFIMAGMIGSVHFMHCNREANVVAHNLAKFAYDRNETCNWVDEPQSPRLPG